MQQTKKQKSNPDTTQGSVLLKQMGVHKGIYFVSIYLPWEQTLQNSSILSHFILHFFKKGIKKKSSIGKSGGMKYSHLFPMLIHLFSETP